MERKGQILVELMVAATLMIIGMLGIFAVLSQSLGLNRVAANQYIGAYLAAEGVEVVKNILDTNAIIGAVAWNENVDAEGDYGVQRNTTVLGGTEAGRATDKLRYNTGTGLYNYDATASETNFVRTVTIEYIDTSTIRVNSVVTWRDRGGADFSVNVEDIFHDWRADL